MGRVRAIGTGEWEGAFFRYMILTYQYERLTSVVRAITRKSERRGIRIS